MLMFIFLKIVFTRLCKFVLLHGLSNSRPFTQILLTALYMQNHRTSVGHLDSVECVELGLLQMLSAVLSGENDADLDVCFRF
jgi:hypothetical protein